MLDASASADPHAKGVMDTLFDVTVAESLPRLVPPKAVPAVALNTGGPRGAAGRCLVSHRDA